VVPSLVRSSRLQQISMYPTAAGLLSRLACARAMAAGVDVAPLMVKASAAFTYSAVPAAPSGIGMLLSQFLC
jgi:hypothetical protein